MIHKYDIKIFNRDQRVHILDWYPNENQSLLVAKINPGVFQCHMIELEQINLTLQHLVNIITDQQDESPFIDRSKINMVVSYKNLIFEQNSLVFCVPTFGLQQNCVNQLNKGTHILIYAYYDTVQTADINNFDYFDNVISI
jgi:hypothetical protein